VISTIRPKEPFPFTSSWVNQYTSINPQRLIHWGSTSLYLCSIFSQGTAVIHFCTPGPKELCKMSTGSELSNELYSRTSLLVISFANGFSVMLLGCRQYKK
jgi:hypothetical protein